MERQNQTTPTGGGEVLQESFNPMSALLEQGYGRAVPERGEVIEGTIVSISPSEILVDIGYKSEGIVTARDLERLDREYRKSLQVGDNTSVYVIRPTDAEGNIILSLSRALMESDWKDAARTFEADEILEKPVTGYNKGGLIVNVGRVRGFVPGSQVVSGRSGEGNQASDREALFAELVGQKLRLKIIEVDRDRNRLILSERAALREWRRGQKDRLIDELKEGEIRRGVVSSLCDFGAFVDLGGADGLVHLSELSWRRVAHPKQALKLGEEVDVYVLGVDRERRRIALSIKRLQNEPWSSVEERYQIGQLVNGTITKITSFGAFAQLDEDIEGLIHISELSEERIEHPGEIVQEGQQLALRIIRIDADKQRMGLSLRRADETKYSEDHTWEEGSQLETSDEPE
ncbi:MAG: hypothetical protein A2Y73_05040 [Chloroflexi bacterium RBG_13_56_8]|nr:MAG: hypothetical protein A2Y73_05040 [Chloroflexi bacterium RBG_13_56_8]